MKKVIAESNKSQLRSEFVQLATEIRDMSKYEFVQLLKNNEFEVAQQWIDTLKNIRDTFKNDAHNAIDYYVARMIVDGKDVGYVKQVYKKSGSRGWSGRAEITVTDDMEEAQLFISEKQARQELLHGRDIGVYLDDVGYRYEPPYSEDHAGELDNLASEINGMDIYYAKDIHYDLMGVEF